MTYSIKLTPYMLLWLSRFGCMYTLFFIFVVFIIAHVEIYPTLYPSIISPIALLHRLFSLYLILTFLLNFVLCYVNNSFVRKNNVKQHDINFNFTDDNNIQKSSNFNPNQSNFHYNPTHSNFNNYTSSSPHYTQPFCRVCLTRSPPRSHHCVICQRCVLVREHHCFVIGSCIGLHNLRFFMGILFLLIIGTIYTIFMSLNFLPLYYPHPFSSRFSIFHYFLPFTFLQAIFGYQPYHFVFHVGVIYTATIAFVAASYSFIYHFSLILRGLTSHEHHTNQTPPYRTPFSNFKDTFGSRWYIGFICPLLYHDFKLGSGVKSV